MVARAAKDQERVKIRVSATGRLSLPAGLRRKAGLERGGTVVAEIKGGAIQLRTIDEILSEARRRARKLMGRNFSVDDFLKFRRTLWKER